MASWQLSASNIGWAKEDDEAVYAAMQAAANPTEIPMDVSAARRMRRWLPEA